ncbi:MAG: TonB-dependent receptor plug domain-containing protein [Bacteroidota bacterium]
MKIGTPPLWVLFALFFQTAHAQKKIRLVDVLKSIEESDSVSFSYDFKLINEVYFPEAYDLQALSKYLKNNKGVELQFLDEGFYSVTPASKSYSFQFNTENGEADLANEIATVSNKGKPIFQEVLENGTLSFEHKPSLEDSIQISVVGYETVNLSSRELLNQITFDKELKIKTTLLKDVIIQNYITRGINFSAIDHKTTINIDDLALLPGETDGDVFSALATLPGVSSPDGRAGNLFLRGSPPDQSFILFNEIPIYHRGHYFGTISPYNPKSIQQIEVSKNGYSAKNGGRVGGLISIRSKPEKSKKPTIGVGANTLYAQAFGNTTFNKNRTQISAGYRQSFPSDWQSPKLEVITDRILLGSPIDPNNMRTVVENYRVNFRDFNIDLIHQINSKNELSIQFLNIFNRTSYDFSEDDLLANEESEFFNNGLNINLQTEITDRIKGTGSFLYSRYTSGFISEQFRGGSPQAQTGTRDNIVEDYSFKYDLEISVGYNYLNAGLELNYQESEFELTNPGNPMMMRPPLVLNQEVSSIIPALYSDFQFNQWDDFFFQAGLRAVYYEELEQFELEPRLFLNYQVSNDILFKSSYGRYNQFIGQVRNLDFGQAGFENGLWLNANEENISPIQSNQFMLGSTLSFGKLTFDVEGFLKYTGDVTFSSTVNLRPNSTFSNADYEAKGVDILLKYSPTQNLDLWSSYSFVDNQFVFDDSDGFEQTPDFDQPHNYSFTGSYQKNRFKFTLGWRWASGLVGRSFELQQELMAATQRPAMPGQGGMMPPPNQPMQEIPERYEPTHALDISSSYTLPKTEKQSFITTFGVSLLNVYDRENVLDQIVGPTGGLIVRNSFGFAPNFMLTVQW